MLLKTIVLKNPDGSMYSVSGTYDEDYKGPQGKEVITGSEAEDFLDVAKAHKRQTESFERLTKELEEKNGNPKEEKDDEQE